MAGTGMAEHLTLPPHAGVAVRFPDDRPAGQKPEESRNQTHIMKSTDAKTN
jgi:hypothetical protein